MSKASNLAGFVTSITPINSLNVGIVTATSFVGNITGTASTAGFARTSFGLTGTPNISVGIVTGTSFFGNGSGLTGVGIGTTGSINTTGIITATSFIGNLNQSVVGNYSETVYNLGNTGVATTINLVNGNFVTATLTDNCTFTFNTGISTGAVSFTLFLTNDATPGRSITWPVSVKWPNNIIPTRTTAANRSDVWSFFTYDNGTTWYGSLSLFNYSS